MRNFENLLFQISCEVGSIVLLKSVAHIHGDSLGGIIETQKSFKLH